MGLASLHQFMCLSGRGCNCFVNERNTDGPEPEPHSDRTFFLSQHGYQLFVWIPLLRVSSFGWQGTPPDLANQVCTWDNEHLLPSVAFTSLVAALISILADLFSCSMGATQYECSAYQSKEQCAMNTVNRRSLVTDIITAAHSGCTDCWQVLVSPKSGPSRHAKQQQPALPCNWLYHSSPELPHWMLVGSGLIQEWSN